MHGILVLRSSHPTSTTLCLANFKEERSSIAAAGSNFCLVSIDDEQGSLFLLSISSGAVLHFKFSRTAPRRKTVHL